MAGVNHTSSLSTLLPASPTIASFSFPMSIIYLLLAVLSFISFARVVYFKHKLKSISTGFLILSFFWSLVRCVVFLFLDFMQQRTIIVYGLLYRFPFLLELATFGLLVLFYASVLHRANWATYWRSIYMSMYIVIMAVFVCGMITIYAMIVISADKHDHVTEQNMLNADTVVRFTMDFVLGTLIAIYGFKVMANWKETKHVLGPGSSQLKLGLLLVMLLVVFLSRVIVGILHLMKIIKWGLGGGFTLKTFLEMLSFMVWEVIPLTVFVLYFWPKGRRAHSKTARPAGYSFSELPTESPKRRILGQSGKSIQSAPALGIFDESMRYDSTEDADDDDAVLGAGSMYSPYATSFSMPGKSPGSGNN